jgi:protein SCO1/2
MIQRKIKAGAWCMVLILTVCCASAVATLPDTTLAKIGFDQKPGGQTSPELPFRDEEGRSIQLGQYFKKTPVILVMGYYDCPMLCTLVLNGLVESLQDLRWSIGDRFQVINVSINPNETPPLARAKKSSYLKRYGRPGATDGWHFLTGDQHSIERLAAEVGFQYVYDASSGQYAHPSGLVFLTPEGKVSGYLFGVTFSPKTVYASLQAAASSKIGSPLPQFVLLCFRYSPLAGKYSATVLFIVRILGVITVVGLGAFVLMMIRAERVRRATAMNGFARQACDQAPLKSLPGGTPKL